MPSLFIASILLLPPFQDDPAPTCKSLSCKSLSCKSLSCKSPNCKSQRHSSGQSGLSTASDRPLSSQEQAATQEIERIRERLGIKIFIGDDTKLRFQDELKSIIQRHQAPLPQLPPAPSIQPKRVKPAAWGGKPATGPRTAWNAGGPVFRNLGNGVGVPVEPPSDRLGQRSGLSKTMNSLAKAVEDLDRSALELERAGEFASSAPLRKLSRRIRRQWERLHRQRFASKTARDH